MQAWGEGAGGLAATGRALLEIASDLDMAGGPDPRPPGFCGTALTVKLPCTAAGLAAAAALRRDAAWCGITITAVYAAHQVGPGARVCVHKGVCASLLGALQFGGGGVRQATVSRCVLEGDAACATDWSEWWRAPRLTRHARTNTHSHPNPCPTPPTTTTRRYWRVQRAPPMLHPTWGEWGTRWGLTRCASWPRPGALRRGLARQSRR